VRQSPTPGRRPRGDFSCLDYRSLVPGCASYERGKRDSVQAGCRTAGFRAAAHGYAGSPTLAHGCAARLGVYGRPVPL
jgi:hypothetical protein